MLKGFPAIVGKQPKVLIVGSMPSITSLKKHEYYGFKHNRFWRIIEAFFDANLQSYDDKVKCLQEHHIALWDVIAYCEREGSLDANIKNIEVNDIVGLLKEYPSIKVVICNGKKSYDVFQKHFKDVSITCLSLPSTSIANRTMTQEKLFQSWFSALENALNLYS